ncbi:hypothetical protein PLICRDRAFT_37904 [Plicaturopsis crispa FD-325 SS-3]|nr:hypothetical protein PLICRDRAFT_37904 [Plicaturopsis crispa FD-325 SS-3]
MPAIHLVATDEIKRGMPLLGLVSSSALFGVTISMTFTYFKQFPRDPSIIKFLVGATCLLDSLSFCFITHACWFYLVDAGSLKVSVWSINAELIVSMLISGISEFFLAYRVWRISGGRYVLTSTIILLALLHFGSGQASAVQYLILKSFPHTDNVQVPSIMRLGSGALCDTSIALSLCYFLHQKRTGYSWTDKVIDRLIMYSINSGLLTSVVSIICIISYFALPGTWAYLGFCFLISRCYTITFLSTLNSRGLLLSRETDFDTESSLFIRPFPLHLKGPGRSGTLRGWRSTTSRGPTATQINVHVVTETITDGTSHVGKSITDQSTSTASTTDVDSTSEPEKV